MRNDPGEHGRDDTHEIPGEPGRDPEDEVDVEQLRAWLLRRQRRYRAVETVYATLCVAAWLLVGLPTGGLVATGCAILAIVSLTILLANEYVVVRLINGSPELVRHFARRTRILGGRSPR